MLSDTGEREDTTNKRGPFSLYGNFVLVPTLYPEEDREQDGYFSVWFPICKQFRSIKVAAVAKHNRNDLLTRRARSSLQDFIPYCINCERERGLKKDSVRKQGPKDCKHPSNSISLGLSRLQSDKTRRDGGLYEK